MDDFLIGPQSDEKEYTWWDYEMEYNDDDEVFLTNDLASSTNRSR